MSSIKEGQAKIIFLMKTKLNLNGPNDQKFYWHFLSHFIVEIVELEQSFFLGGISHGMISLI